MKLTRRDLGHFLAAVIPGAIAATIAASPTSRFIPLSLIPGIGTVLFRQLFPSSTPTQPAKEQAMSFSISGFGHVATELLDKALPDLEAAAKAVEEEIVADLTAVVKKYEGHFQGLTFSGQHVGSVDVKAAADAQVSAEAPSTAEPAGSTTPESASTEESTTAAAPSEAAPSDAPTTSAATTEASAATGSEAPSGTAEAPVGGATEGSSQA